MTKNGEDLIVYYSPYSIVSGTNWDILHEKPIKVFDYLKPKLNPECDFNYLLCPATQNVSKKIFRLINTMDSKYVIEDNFVKGVSKNFISAGITRVPSLVNEKIIELNMNFIFFTEEESLTMTLLPPIMERAPHLQYGAVVTGSFDIGKYLRQIGIEYNLWENVNKFEIKKNEPYAYVMFETDRPVKLVRFVISPLMKQYVDVMTLSSGWEKKVSLVDRYKRFKAANMKKLVMREIKNNLIEE